MFKKSRLCTAALLALGGGLTLTSVQVLAQSQPAERIEITGSRIKTLTVDTPSPVTVIDAKEIKVDGVRNVESFLNNLPQVFADQGANVVNGATGTAAVNLRGLGAERSLVLVNGRRMTMGSPNTVAPDLNQIPAGLVKRVELLTGGASAVYGSDAVSGVVNFIMNDKFEGFQIDLNHSFFNHSQQGTAGVADLVRARSVSNPAEFKVPGDKSADGKSTNLSITMGRNFDGGKGNATLFLNYKKDDALLQSERDFSACSLGSSAAGFACGGSGTNATSRITNLTNNTVWTNADRNGTARPYNGATDAYNFGPLNYYQRPSERYGFNAFGNYEILPSAKAYMEFGFHDDRTVAQIAPGGAFGSVHTIRGDNPLLSASWRTALGLVNPTDTVDIVLQRRNVEGGGRQSEFRNTSFRTVAGVKGELGKWSYDAFLIEGKVIYSQSENNYFLSPRIDQAMNVVNVNGVAQCAPGAAAGCVPYNPFLLGGVTAAQLAFLQTPGFRKGETSLKMQGVNLSTDLADYGMKLPMASNGVGVSFGLENRTEALELFTDPATTNGELSGSGGPTKGLQGQYNVKELFAELRIPIIEKKGIELLQATVTGRTSKYDTGIKTNTSGLGIEFSPIKQLKFRASAQRAVRAPNLIELFTAQGNNLYDNDADPCAGATPTATLAQCARTGVTAAQYGTIQDSPAGQYNYLQGGNPNLKPEKAKSLTLGVVATPMPQLTVSLDYFDIKVKDTIDNVDPTTTLEKCLSTGDARFCSQITRDRLGTLWLLPEASINGLNQNIGSTSTSGFDIAAAYTHRMKGMGTLGLSYVGTILKKLETLELPGDPSYDCAGLYGANKCESPNPKYRHKIRATWNTPWDVEAAFTWRHIAKVNHQTTSGQAGLPGSVPAVDRVLAAQNYLDVAATWNFNKSLTVSLGINNLLDKDPPITAQLATGQGNGNTYPQVYDALGRRVFLTASYKF